MSNCNDCYKEGLKEESFLFREILKSIMAFMLMLFAGIGVIIFQAILGNLEIWGLFSVIVLMFILILTFYLSLRVFDRIKHIIDVLKGL